MPKHSRLKKKKLRGGGSIGSSRSSTPRAEEEDLEVEFKLLLLEEVLRGNNHYELVLLALSDGGISPQVRLPCWCRLLEVDETKDEVRLSHVLCNTKDSRQIELDVARSYGGALHGSEKRSKLKTFLRSFFAARPDLHYYQGFHDVCIVVLYVTEEQPLLQHRICENICDNFLLRDALHTDFTKVEALSRCVGELVKLADPTIGRLLESIPSFWSVSMLITWFAHDIPDIEAKARVFDAVLASPTYFPIYLAAALPLLPNVREALVNAETESFHDVLRNAAKQIDSIVEADQLIRTARELVDQVSPSLFISHAELQCDLPITSQVFQLSPFHPTWIPPKPASWLRHQLRALSLKGRRFFFLPIAVAVIAVLWQLVRRF